MEWVHGVSMPFWGVQTLLGTLMCLLNMDDFQNHVIQGLYGGFIICQDLMKPLAAVLLIPQLLALSEICEWKPNPLVTWLVPPAISHLLGLFRDLGQ